MDHGTGTAKNASNAQTDGLSTATTSVSLSLTNAQPTITQEAALPASRATTLRMDNACSHYQTTRNQLMLDAEPGTGITKLAFHAQTDGSSMIRKSVLLFLTNAPPTIVLETASPAIRDTISRREPVSSPASTMPSPLIQDAAPGIGTTKFASLALRDGSSTTKRSAFQFLTNVLQAIRMETALPASRDMTLRTAPAFSLSSTMLTPLTQDVVPGTGIAKSAFPALKDGFSMRRKFAFPYLTNVLPMTTKETVLHASRDTI